MAICWWHASPGSVWGHGAYQAPDWTADWLHRELVSWLNLAAEDQFGTAYDELNEQQQHMLRYDLKKIIEQILIILKPTL